MTDVGLRSSEAVEHVAADRGGDREDNQQSVAPLTSPLENNNSSWSYSYDRVAVRKFEFCSAQFFLFFLIFSRRERETDRGICYLICYLSPRDLDKIQLMRE